MDVHNTFVLPTTCDNAVYAHFTSPLAHNLIVSKGNILQIFEIEELKPRRKRPTAPVELPRRSRRRRGKSKEDVDHMEGEVVPESKPEAIEWVDPPKPYSLNLITEYSINGKIFDLHTYRSQEAPLIDYIIVSTELAKLSIIKWNSSLNIITSVSLHDYESVLESLVVENLDKIDVLHRSDPNSLCEIIVAENVLAFLPFNKFDADDDVKFGDMDLKYQQAENSNPIESDTPTKKLKSILTKSKNPKAKKKTVQILTPEEEEARNVVTQANIKGIKKKSKKDIKTHFTESFVLNASNLNRELKNIVDIQFLHSYSDPTIAILYAPETYSWSGYLPKIKDNLSVTVLSLDLDNQRANSIMEIPNLPYDLNKIYPLNNPINGFLLLGSNEIIHINSLGSTKGVFVNEFFEKTSDMILKNQSVLDLKVENSQVCQIGRTNEVLLISELGQFYTLIFDEVGGISNLNRIVANEPAYLHSIEIHSIQKITHIVDLDLLFLSCIGSDSLLIQHVPLKAGEKSIANQSQGNNSNPHMFAKSSNSSNTSIASMISEINEDDDSWLYNDEQNDDSFVDSATKSLTNCKFIEIDRLLNIGPCKDFTLGYISVEPKIRQLPNANFKETAIVASSGLDHCSGVSILNPTIKPILKDRLKLTAATRLWTLDNYFGETKYIISTDAQSNSTDIYLIAKDYQSVHGNYNRKSYTIQFGSIDTAYGIKPVQITPHKVTVYNMAFNVTVNLTYDKVINYAQIFDHYIMLIMTTGELELLYYNEEEKQLDKLDLPALLNFQIITNGWISKSNFLKPPVSKKRDYEGNLKSEIVESEVKSDDEKVVKDDDMKGEFDDKKSEVDDKKRKADDKGEMIFWLVTGDNRLLVFQKDHLERVFEFKDVFNLPMYLNLGPMDPNYEADVDPMLKQVMFTSLGSEFQSKDYLFLLTFGGEILIYETYLDLNTNIIKFIKSNDTYKFPITGAPENSYKYATKIERMMFKIDDIDKKQSVFVSGAMPFLICKETNSLPRMFKFTSKPMLSFARMNTATCSSGVVCLDDKMHIRSFELNPKWDLSNLIPIQKEIIGETIDKIQYNEACHVYIVTTLNKKPYKPLDEDENEMGVWDKNLRLQGGNYIGSIKLISPENWSVIDTVELNENEVCTSLEMMKNLMVSNSQVGMLQLKISNSKRARIFVGTGIYSNEDMPANGTWKLYDIVRVNPDPDRPETIWKLRSETNDDVTRGPVLSACEISGRFGVIQGQRMLIRTLKDDGNAVPVAFTDTGLCTKRVKSFENLVIIGDSFQGLELFGFDADPYRMIPLSKDEEGVKINECDFIVYDRKLFIVCSDDSGIIHLLQYDPDDVHSIRGQRLIHKTSFQSNNYTTKMVNVSRRNSTFSMVSTLPFRKEFDLGYEVLGSTIEGAFYRVTPVADYQHRRLQVIQSYISEKRAQWLGLNVSAERGSFIEMRHISRFLALDEEIKKKIASKLGKTALTEIYRDIIGVQ